MKGMAVNEAIAQLHFMSKGSARPLQKLLKAAAADAEHNFQLAKDDLVVKSMIVNAAATIKRFMPRAFGRAGMIRKRGSNVIVILESHTGATVSLTKYPSEQKADIARASTKRGLTKKMVEEDGSVKKSATAYTKRFFNRKTG